MSLLVGVTVDCCGCDVRCQSVSHDVDSAGLVICQKRAVKDLKKLKREFSVEDSECSTLNDFKKSIMLV